MIILQIINQINYPLFVLVISILVFALTIRHVYYFSAVSNFYFSFNSHLIKFTSKFCIIISLLASYLHQYYRVNLHWIWSTAISSCAQHLSQDYSWSQQCYNLVDFYFLTDFQFLKSVHQAPGNRDSIIILWQHQSIRLPFCFILFFVFDQLERQNT